MNAIAHPTRRQGASSRHFFCSDGEELGVVEGVAMERTSR
jgi:hypothetical protein